MAASLVDVALLPAGGRDAAPRLLTLDHDASAPGRAVLTVLERSGGRWSARAGGEHRPPTLARTTVPWLVAIDERRFVLITVAPEAAVTWLAGVTWTGDELRIGPVASVGWIADAALAADAFGDGTPDLVLIESRTRRGGGTCQSSQISVLDGQTLRVARDWELTNLRLAAGVTGELDETPGADLAAAAYSNCPAGPATPNRLRIVGVRLADGAILADRRVAPADELIAWSGRPVIVDVDGDGRQEVLVGSRDSLVVLDPARGWDATEVGGARGVLLGAVGHDVSTGATVATMADDAVRITRLHRDADRWTAATTLRVDATTDPAGWGAARLDVRATAIRSGGAGWYLGEPGCPSLVVPLAVASCDPGTRASAGPAWLATRPIAALAEDRLLVAQTDAWRAPGMRLVSPSPMAVERPGGAWRHGPSEPFTLVEVAAALDQPAVPDARAEPLAGGSPPAATIAGVPGTRLAWTARGGSGAAAGPGSGSLAGLLAVLPRDGATVDFGRIPDTGRLEVALPGRPGGAPPEWTVEHVAIGPLGDASLVVGSIVSVDSEPPAVAIDDAFLRLPWPFHAALTGRTEPGATVSSGAQQVVAGDDGRFALATRLPPWPSQIEVRATDQAGNVATVTADMMGGADLRRLPWIPIVVVGVVAGAALSGLRGRRPEAPSRPGGGDVASPDEDGPAIEELQPRRLQ